MKSPASLLRLTVGDYFKSCNWQLLPPPSCDYLPKQAKIVLPQRPTVLSALSVKEFFDTCNWQLLIQNEPEQDNDSTSPVLPPPVESNLQNVRVLQRLTVTEFFSLCNWQSLPSEPQIQLLTLELAELPLEQKSPLTWQVKAFFQQIFWEGSPVIGRLPQKSSKLQELIPASEKMNLNDLSNLF